MSLSGIIVSFIAIGTLNCVIGTNASSINEIVAGFKEANKPRIMQFLNDSLIATKETCRINQKPSIVQAIDENHNATLDCFNDSLKLGKLIKSSLLHVLNPDKTMPAKVLCDTITDTLECASNFSSIVKPCFDPEERLIYEIYENVTRIAANFLCRENRTNAKRFTETDGVRCLMSRADQMEYIDEVNVDYVELPDGATPPSQDVTAILAHEPFDKQSTCSSFETKISELRTRIDNEVRNCGEPTPADVFTDLFNEVKICKDVPQGSAH